MKTVLTALALFAGLAACGERGQESARGAESADTSFVTSDTSVQVDTTVKEGDVKRDTAKY
jgi:hypothetical protein